MLIVVGGSSEAIGTVIVAPGFKAKESFKITDRVQKSVDSRGTIPEIRYHPPDDPKTYISGYLHHENKFHIISIVNGKRKDKETAGMVEVIKAFFSDMERRDIVEVDTNCLLKLVPILIKRYGFESTDGKSLEVIMQENKGINSILPGLIVPLIKRFKK